MQITETLSEPLRREFTVTVVASDLDAKLTGKIVELQPKIHLKGFRPGKAPVSFLKKTYGKSLMGDIVNETINQSSEQLLKDKEIKPATTPRFDFVNPLDSVVAGKADLEFTLKVDLMPDFQLANLSELKAERLVSDVSDEAVDESLKRFSDSQKTYSDKGEGAAAEKGDAVTIDFEGKIGGEAFEGGKAEDFDLTLGSGSFIPGFEDQLIGMAAGETRTVKVTFPANYPNAALAGKEAEFEVVAKTLEAPGAVEINEALATSLGMESLDKLKGLVKERIAREHGGMSRQKLKRQLLDQLDTMHKFAPPPTLVEDEFTNVWNAIENDLKQQGRTFADEGTTEEKARDEYRGIAERRVRLGLVLAEIGEKNNIKVADDELSRAIVERARQVPGREQEVWDYYRKNPQALASVRAPLFEEKVVDFLVELAKVTDKQVSREELYKEDEDGAPAT